jgi:hypothetical protein
MENLSRLSGTLEATGICILIMKINSTAASNKSLDASGGSVFLNWRGAAKRALIRAAASTQTLGVFSLVIRIAVAKDLDG